ncbi:MAG: hypothetical protein ACI9YR_002812, partial [Bacteroidia bacterium]
MGQVDTAINIKDFDLDRLTETELEVLERKIASKY